MGVNQAHYVMAGMQLSCDGIQFEDIEDIDISYWDQPKDKQLGVLYDGMSGDYLMAGMVLAATSDEQDIFGEDPVACEVSDQDILAIKKFLVERLEVENPIVRIYAITHHT